MGLWTEEEGRQVEEGDRERRDEKEVDELSKNPKKNKIDGYTYKQFEQMLRDSKRLRVYQRHAMPKWGSEDFKIAHQNPMTKDAFLEGGGLEQYEVIISSNANNKD